MRLKIRDDFTFRRLFMNTHFFRLQLFRHGKCLILRKIAAAAVAEDAPAHAARAVYVRAAQPGINHGLLGLAILHPVVIS